MSDRQADWPALPYAEWEATRDTVHMWTQIVGKTRLALEAGFRAIDTANQRKHYFEAGVGAALQSALRAGDVTRSELFLQTKFTFSAGQDARLPYDRAAAVAEQVAQSFDSSLYNLVREGRIELEEALSSADSRTNLEAKINFG